MGVETARVAAAMTEREKEALFPAERRMPGGRQIKGDREIGKEKLRKRDRKTGMHGDLCVDSRAQSALTQTHVH